MRRRKEEEALRLKVRRRWRRTRRQERQPTETATAEAGSIGQRRSPSCRERQRLLLVVRCWSAQGRRAHHESSSGKRGSSLFSLLLCATAARSLSREQID